MKELSLNGRNWTVNETVRHFPGHFHVPAHDVPGNLLVRMIRNGKSGSAAGRQRLHEGKEMFRLTGTKIFIP